MTDIDPEIDPELEAMALAIQDVSCARVGLTPVFPVPQLFIDDAVAARNASRQWMRENGEVSHAIRLSEIYDRVHEEIESGKSWDDIDSGMTQPQPTYPQWQAYMQQSLLSCLRSFILTIRDTP